MGVFPNSVRQALPVLCMQCEEPDCMKVCPTGATYQTEDKIVRVDKDKCIGCKYCMQACPYGARYSVGEWKSYFPEGLPLSDYEKYSKQVWEEKRGLGVATKCDFCIDRRAEGREAACVQACSAKARVFGDLDDPESEISYLIKTKRGFVLRPEVGTEPKVYYLPPR
jgi:molybdopterin-containing oxidoreductase family iron-sulfur binding subunit